MQFVQRSAQVESFDPFGPLSKNVNSPKRFTVHSQETMEDEREFRSGMISMRQGYPAQSEMPYNKKRMLSSQMLSTDEVTSQSNFGHTFGEHHGHKRNTNVKISNEAETGLLRSYENSSKDGLRPEVNLD